jgi:phosphoribosylanthranilate isomerase
MVWIKICGITTAEDAELAAAFGADAIGVNLVPSSPRRVEREQAQQIVRAVRGRVEILGVVADLALDAARALRKELELDALQLHGSEPAETLSALLPGAFKAMRIGSAADVEAARTMPGDRLLIDAKVDGRLGGTGVRVDPALVRELVRARRVILAGGLTAHNVALVLGELSPWGVDVASGVELRGDPRRKDPAALRAFVEQVRRSGA